MSVPPIRRLTQSEWEERQEHLRTHGPRPGAIRRDIPTTDEQRIRINVWYPDREVARWVPPGIVGLLRFTDGPLAGRQERVTRPIFAMGRHPDMELVLQDPAASAKHAAVVFLHGIEWSILDLGSTNSTLVNGQTVGERILRVGDQLVVGDSLIEFGVGIEEDDVDEDDEEVAGDEG